MAQRKLRRPFGTTGQGVHPGSEVNLNQRSQSESEMPAARKGEGRGLKGPGVYPDSTRNQTIYSWVW